MRGRGGSALVLAGEGREEGGEPRRERLLLTLAPGTLHFGGGRGGGHDPIHPKPSCVRAVTARNVPRRTAEFSKRVMHALAAIVGE